MGINDRIKQIARAYMNSASENLSQNLDDLKKKAVSGELKEDIFENFNHIFKKTGEKTEEQLSEEEVERLIREELNGDFGFDSSSFASGRKNTKSQTPKKVDAIKKAYQRLGVTENMSLKEIEKVYKKEIRQYHPDLFSNSPEKMQSATKIAQILTESWNLIRQHRSE